MSDSILQATLILGFNAFIAFKINMAAHNIFPH